MEYLYLSSMAPSFILDRSFEACCGLYEVKGIGDKGVALQTTLTVLPIALARVDRRSARARLGLVFRGDILDPAHATSCEAVDKFASLNLRFPERWLLNMHQSGLLQNCHMLIISKVAYMYCSLKAHLGMGVSQHVLS